MAKNTVLGIPKDYASFNITFTPSDTTMAKTLYTFPADDANLILLTITSDDTANQNIQFIIDDGSVAAPVWLVPVPLGSGTSSGVNAVNALNSTNCPMALYDDTGLNRFIPGTATMILKAKSLTTITTAKTITIHGTVARFAA
jgi:hypothetical protein